MSPANIFEIEVLWRVRVDGEFIDIIYWDEHISFDTEQEVLMYGFHL